MNEFDYANVHTVTIADAPAMKKALAVSDYPSCEYACANLILWAEVYNGTKLAEFEGRMYFHMPTIDELLFPCGGNGMPSPEELSRFSAGMKRAGFSGMIAHVPTKYTETPHLTDFYDIQPMDPGNDEYIYKTEALAELKGSKLSKKRNLISQFQRNYEQYKLTEIRTPEDFRTITELSNDWMKEHQDTQDIEDESKVIAKALAHFTELGLQGIMLKTPDGLKAYAVYSPINSNSYTIHFEKALAECKGASQVITNQTAVALQGKCEYINREQDLGLPGLRRAKLSYMPDHMLKDFLLIPKQ